MNTPAFNTGSAIIQVDDSGQNCIMIEAGANATPTADSVRAALRTAAPGDWLLAQNETTAVAEAIRAAHEKGMKTALNPAPMTGAVATFPLDVLDELIVNEIEGAELLRHLGGSDEREPGSMLQELHRKLPHARIVMTLGEKGVMAIDEAGLATRAPAFSVQAVDTTAAGDTFVGYYLAARMRGDGMIDALRLASAAAALSVTRPGAPPSVPTQAEVSTWIQKS